MKHELTGVAKLIPKKEINRIFSLNPTIGAENDLDFLCFDKVYESVQKAIKNPKETTIIDLGCSYNAQCYYFKDCKQVLSIDLPMKNLSNNNQYAEERFKTDNDTIYLMSIQQWIQEVLPTLNFDLNNCIAICSYVPDKEAQKLVAETFPNNFVVYCNDIISCKMDKYPDFHYERKPIPKPDYSLLDNLHPYERY